jgi:hypothetical protein
MVRRTVLGDDSFAVRRAALPHEKHAMRVRNINEDSFAVRRAVSGERLAVSCNEVAFRAAPLPFVHALRIFRSSSAAFRATKLPFVHAPRAFRSSSAAFINLKTK